MTLNGTATEPLLLDRDGPVATLTINRPSTREQTAAYDDAVLAAEEALATFPAPTIAAIGGYCYGGGCGLALACDIRFAWRAPRPTRGAPPNSASSTRCMTTLTRPYTSSRRCSPPGRALPSARSSGRSPRILDGVTTDDEGHAELRVVPRRTRLRRRHPCVPRASTPGLRIALKIVLAGRGNSAG
jgi:Enoyl-CoA hydratase/isomerase